MLILPELSDYLWRDPHLRKGAEGDRGREGGRGQRASKCVPGRLDAPATTHTIPATECGRGLLGHQQGGLDKELQDVEVQAADGGQVPVSDQHAELGLADSLVT